METPFDIFFEHARSLNVLTEAELDAVTDEIANGKQTEEGAIAAWFTRTQDAVWPFYKALTEWGTPTEPLRFAVGDRVQADVGDGWAPATVVATWYREDEWPVACRAPYQMRLDQGPLIYAPVDGESFVIAAGERPPRKGKADKALMLGYGCASSKKEREASGYGPLHVCCMMRGDPAALARLLRRPLPDCNPNNNRNRHRESPLCMAANYGTLHCAILLLAAGADPRVPNCYGKSAVTVAAGAAEKGGMGSEWAHEALVALLKRREAELDAEDAEEKVIGECRLDDGSLWEGRMAADDRWPTWHRLSGATGADTAEWGLPVTDGIIDEDDAAREQQMYRDLVAGKDVDTPENHHGQRLIYMAGFPYDQPGLGEVPQRSAIGYDQCDCCGDGGSCGKGPAWKARMKALIAEKDASA